jgi:hypothetical protein
MFELLCNLNPAGEFLRLFEHEYPLLRCPFALLDPRRACSRSYFPLSKHSLLSKIIVKAKTTEQEGCRSFFPSPSLASMRVSVITCFPSPNFVMFESQVCPHFGTETRVNI